MSNQGLKHSSLSVPENSLYALFQSFEITGLTGYPSLAYVTAGSITFSSVSLPNFSESSAQAEGAPGTITGIQPRFGIAVYPCFFTFSAVIAMGALPLALRP